MVDLLVDFRPARLDDALALLGRADAGFVDDAVGAGLRLIEDLARLSAGLLDHVCDLHLGVFQGAGALVGGREPVGNVGPALFDGSQDRRPDELHRKPDEGEEGEPWANSVRLIFIPVPARRLRFSRR